MGGAVHMLFLKTSLLFFFCQALLLIGARPSKRMAWSDYCYIWIGENSNSHFHVLPIVCKLVLYFFPTSMIIYDLISQEIGRGATIVTPSPPATVGDVIGWVPFQWRHSVYSCSKVPQEFVGSCWLNPWSRLRHVRQRNAMGVSGAPLTAILGATLFQLVPWVLPHLRVTWFSRCL